MTSSAPPFSSRLGCARRANAGAILVSSAVRELCLGKGLQFEDKGLVELKGFDEPVHVYGVIWT